MAQRDMFEAPGAGWRSHEYPTPKQVPRPPAIISSRESALRRVQARRVYREVLDEISARYRLTNFGEPWMLDARYGMRPRQDWNPKPDAGKEEGVTRRRETVTRSGRRGQTTERGSFDEPLKNRPENAPPDRVGALNRGKSASPKDRGNFFGSFGRGDGIAGSSYKERSFIKMITTPMQRISTTAAGFWVATAGKVGNRIAENIDKRFEETHGPGGIMNVNPSSVSEIKDLKGMAVSASIGALRGSAGTLYDVATGVGRFGAAMAHAAGLVSDSGFVSAMQKYQIFADRVQAFSEHGYASVTEMKAIQKRWGSKAAYEAYQRGLETASVAGRQAARFFREASSEIASEIIGVSAKDVANELIGLHGQTLDQFAAAKGLRGISQFGSFRTTFTESFKRFAGTKE